MKAIIIGAGIGGLTAGIALQRPGIDVEIFERASEMHEVGAGISLWANAMRALTALGLGPVVEAASMTYTAAGLRTWRGDTISAVSGDELTRLVGKAVIIMHRADLQSALLTAVAPAPVRLGYQCNAVSQTATSVTARFANGEEAHADLLIGADGLRSVVRSALHGDERPRYAGCTAWRSVVHFDTTTIRASESWGFGSVFGQVPLSGGRVYWYGTKNTPEGGRNSDEKTAVAELFRGWHAPIEALIEATDRSSLLRNDLYDRPPLKRWGSGRITLLGDAAHPMLPFLGQGGCQALEDAAALGECFRGTGDVLTALRAYEGRRLRRANAFVTRSHHVGRIAQLENPLGVWLRNRAVAMIGPRVQARQLARLIAAR